MNRRRLAVTGVVLTGLIGEWLGHSLAYYRVAGLAGLQAGLTSGVHDYMLPVGVALLALAAVGSAVWSRAWIALGRRLDSSARALSRLPREAAGVRRRPPARPGPTDRGAPAPAAARTAALGSILAVLQTAVYLLQENLERAVHGLAPAGLTPLTDGFGAAVWIQALVAFALAPGLLLAMRALRMRRRIVERRERLLETLCERRQRHAPAPTPVLTFVRPAQLLLGSALWQRPPPVSPAA